MTSLLEIVDLAKHYPVASGLLDRSPQSVVRAVDGVSLSVAPGETLALVGESGCGKSTLARLVLRLIDVTSGSICFDGEDITKLSGSKLRQLRRRMQIVFQDPFSSLNPHMTVREIIEEPLIVHGVGHKASMRARCDELLTLVGLDHSYASRLPHEFSGGQRQRIGIARALALQPELVVCDEPVSALDVSVQAQIINLLKDLQARFGLSYLFIAHDLAVVKHMADRVAVMYLGRIVESGPRDILFGQPKHPYTQSLLAAVPRPNPHFRRKRYIKDGDLPSPLATPSGCRFHTRCPHAIPLCVKSEPILEAVGDNHIGACHRWRELTPYVADQSRDERLTATAKRLELYDQRRNHVGISAG